MPITIKTGAMKYKKPNGEYDGFNAIAQESTDQQIASIQTAGAAQVNAVQTTGAAQVSAVQQKGAETLDSIPDDYTELAGDVSSLKSALQDAESASGIYTSGYEQGTINAENGTNNNNYPNVRVRTTGYVKIEPEMLLLKSGTDGIKFTMCVYDENYTFVQTIAHNVLIGVTGNPDYFDVSGAVSDIANAEYIRYGYEAYPQRNISAEEANNIAILVWKKADVRDAREIESLQTNVETELNDFATLLRRAVCDNLLPSLSGKYAVIPYLPVGTKITISRKDGLKLNTSEYRPYFVTYDSNGTQVGNASTNVDATYKTITLSYDAFFIGWSGAPTTDYMVNIGNEALPWQEYYPSPVVLSQQNKNELGLLSNSEKGYIHIDSASTIRTTVNSDGTISLVFGRKLIVCFNSAFRTTLDWSDISTNIASYITISGNSATIIVPVYRSLVLNLNDLKLYFRSNNAVESDFVIISNGTYLPQGWAVDMENYQVRLTSDTVIEREGTSKYETFTQSVLQDQCQRFSETLLDVEHCESFLFYTDPHAMGNLYSVNKLNTYQVFNAVLKYYEATPTDFVICGGDWLDNSDTPEQAAFKLGFIKGSVKNSAPTYLLVGNHDTNYQGTERLSNQSMKTLWYDGKPTYYRFKGRETAFYCFDTGVENQELSAQDNLGYEQATWFATNLLTESEAHTVVCMHILYYTLNPLSIQPLAQTVLDVSKAYNDRDAITVNGQTFNFSNVSGKVELLIAGHTHVDGSYTVNGIPCVVTRNTWIPSNSTWAFDLMSIDYDNRKVNIIRAGTNGTDRTVSLV